MGYSINSSLEYGIDLGYEDGEVFDLFRNEEGWIDFENYLCKEASLPDYAENGTQEEFDVLYERRRKIINACPVDLISYGHHEYSSYVVIIRGKSMYEVDPHKMLDMGEDRVVIMEWCKKHGLEVEEPKWHLCASYG